jgi:hypothetical protein
MELLLMEFGLFVSYIGFNDRDFKIKYSAFIYIVFRPDFAA